MPYKKKDGLFKKGDSNGGHYSKGSSKKGSNSTDTDDEFVEPVSTQPTVDLSSIAVVKPAGKSNMTGKLLLIGAIVLTVLAITAAAIFSYSLYKNEVAVREAAALDALPRIIVPEGHFNKPTAATYEYTFLKDMKAIKITPKVDVYADLNADAAALGAEVDAIIKNVKALGFNSIVVDTKYDNSVIFNSTVLEKTPVDLLSIIVEKAKAEGINVVSIFNVTGVNNTAQETIKDYYSQQNKEDILNAVTELANSYELDSILLDNYYSSKNAGAYAQFMEYGGVGNFEEWLYSNSTSTIGSISQTVNAAANSMPTGLLVKDTWADEKDKEGGSKTTSEFSAYKNGYTDTKAIVEQGLVSFVNADIKTSLDNKNMPFKTVASWWNEVCNVNKTPLYITHAGENANSKQLAGWDGTDQLARQVSTSLKNSNYHGSAFSGLKSMMANMKTSTDILLKYYKDEYSDDELFKNLTISSPDKKQFVTYEENVQFRGKFDSNQEVFLNGTKIVPSEKGGFSVWVPLKVGKNTVTLEHKGKTTTYTIERKVIIFKTVSPTGAMKVPGGSQIEFNVMAYKGSKITATLNGKTVTLQEGGGGEDNVLDSAYVNFQGNMTLPKSTAKDQNLGSIKFSGNYQGYGESKTGSSIVVEKLPDEVDPDSATGQVLQHAVVKTTYANTYPYKTTPGYPQGILYQLPSGVQDIVTSISGDFVNLRSGKTVKKGAVSLQDIPFEGNNSITQFSAGVEGNDTVIRATMNWKSPFSITPSPYPTDPSQTAGGYSFSANSVTILLDYATTMAKDNVVTDLSSSPIFSGISMERVKNDAMGIYQYKITLPLSQTGRYYGAHAEYDGNTLVIRFNHPPSGGSLSGLKVVLDPGHGGSDHGTRAGGDILEKEANLIMANKFKSELEALGAEVVMTRYDDTNPSLEQRTAIAHANKADIFISCHHNSAAPNPSPNGVETFFNAPFSQPLAKYIQGQLGQILTNRGAKSSVGNYNFVVTREKQFPSVLIEFGFLSNPQEEQKIMDPSHQDAMARAAAQGVLDYYNAYN